MDREQLAFLLYEQASKDFLAEFLSVDIEDIEEADDDLLQKRVEDKVNSMTKEEFLKMVEEDIV